MANQIPVFKPGINYDSYFKKNVTQSMFNLRLTEMIKQMLKEMKDEIFSDTFVINSVDNFDQLIEWAKSQEKTPKASDTIIVSSGPLAGAYIVKNKTFSTVDDIVKIPGSNGGGSSSETLIKIGENTYSPDAAGIIDISNEFQNVTQDISNVETVVTEVKTGMEANATDISEIKAKTDYIEVVHTEVEE